MAALLLASCDDKTKEPPVRPTDLEPPGPITTLTAIDSTDTSITLRWIAPADSPNGSAASLYEMHRWSDGGSWNSADSVSSLPIPATPGNAQTMQIEGLHSYKRYHFQLRSRDAGGLWSAPSNEVVCRTAWPDSGGTCPQPGLVGSPPAALLAQIRRNIALRLAAMADPDSCPPIPITDSPVAPYQHPVWLPNGLIGCMHIPLLSIGYPNGVECPPFGQTFDIYRLGFWLMNSDGTGQHRLTSPLEWFYYPDWSSDGEWLVFQWNYQIYKVHFVGGDLDMNSIFALTCDDENNYCATWSPDNTLVAYEHEADGSRYIAVIRATGKGRTYVTHGQNPDWHPDGIHLVCTKDAEICRVNVSDPSDVVQLTTFNGGARYAFLRLPRYSPDGSRIAFIVEPVRLDSYAKGLFVMNSDGSGQRQLPVRYVTSGEGAPCWNADGTELLYVQYDSSDWGAVTGTLWCINVDTGAKRQITFNPDPDAVSNER